MFKALIVSAALIGAASAAQAMPVFKISDEGAKVELVSGGCGPFGHRTYWGECRPNGWGPGWRAGAIAVCPPGYHLGPYGRACWPNRRFFY